MNRIIDYENLSVKIQDWIKSYVEDNNITYLVIGVSGGIDSALVAASDATLNLSARVGNIVTIAPCLVQELDTFWLLAKDLPTIYAFY